jgi:ABC-type sugar transport system substrate-binding protein
VGKVVKIIAASLALIMAFGVLASCESGDNPSGPANEGVSSVALGGAVDIYNTPIKISVISISTAGVVSKLYQDAMKEQASLYPNVTLEFKDSEYNPNRQITLIEEAITQGFNAIILEAMDPVATNEAIEQAERAGIPVLTVNGAQPSALHSMNIAGAPYFAGWESARLLDEMTRGQPDRTCIILDAPAALKISANMGTGFQEYIEQKTDIRLLEPAIGIENFLAENAQTAMRDMLTKYGPGEITMVYCASDDFAVGALNAIDQAGRTGEILMFAMMGYPPGLEAVRDGRMTGTMFNDTYTQSAYLFYNALYFISVGLTAYTAGYSVTPRVEMPLFPVTAENVDFMIAISRYGS